MKDSYKEVFGDKERIMTVMAHPDDLEIICGGTVARLIKDGKKVRTVCMTKGEKGMHDSTEYTNEEFGKMVMDAQFKAARILGVNEDEIYNLEIPDGEVETDMKTIEKLAFHLREFRPEIVITQNPFDLINDYDENIRWINHRDHRHTGEVTLDATYPYCRDVGFFRDQIEKQGLKPHYVDEFLFSDSYMKKSAVGFEVSDFVEVKRKALECHLVGGKLSKEDIEEEFMAELKKENGNFEVMAWEKIE